jgi:arabinofuranosyltransferase
MARVVTPLIVLAALGLAALRWQQTAFLCDDAFIAFRYVANAHAGHGLVWNTAPFLPVEGYSCFLWVLSLWAAWSWTGVEPPAASNVLALACGLATLLVTAVALQRTAQTFGRARFVVLGLALLAIVGNRTFVTWLSSGLETAMFDLWVVAWTLRACRPPERRGPGFVAGLAVLAALAALTRPDGALFLAATVLIAVHEARRGARPALLGLLPLLLPVLHVGWRRAFYGEWLPNTYYAKVTSPWPESGLRYLYCFSIEHGLWLLAALVAAAAVRCRGAAGRGLLRARLPALVACGTWCAFAGYYTAVVGGDHFEYRPFAPFVPLAVATAVAALAALRCRGTTASLFLAAFTLAADGFGWFFDRALPGAPDPSFATTAERVPRAVRPLFRFFDRQHAWLRLHFVGLRRELHDGFCRHLLAQYGDRADALPADPADRAVLVAVNAGVVAWTQPNVAILDLCGLNDWVIARTPPIGPPVPLPDDMVLGTFDALDADHDGRLRGDELDAALRLARVENLAISASVPAWATLLSASHDRDDDGFDRAEFTATAGLLRWTRRMAHERGPPADYVDAFRPNLVADGDRLAPHPRAAPLTDQDIAAAERRFRGLRP